MWIPALLSSLPPKPLTIHTHAIEKRMLSVIYIHFWKVLSEKLPRVRNKGRWQRIPVEREKPKRKGEGEKKEKKEKTESEREGGRERLRADEYGGG